MTKYHFHSFSNIQTPTPFLKNRTAEVVCLLLAALIVAVVLV